MNERNLNKVKMEDRLYEIMKDEKKFCTDDTHRLACKIIREDHGIVISPEIISKLRSIDRSRQKVLRAHPELDRRTRTLQLEKNDREYYGKKTD